MNYLLNVKSSSIVHTLLSNCVKLLGKVQKLLIKCISYSIISKRIRVVSPKFYTARKNLTGPPVPPVPTNLVCPWLTAERTRRSRMWEVGIPPLYWSPGQCCLNASLTWWALLKFEFNHISWIILISLRNWTPFEARKMSDWNQKHEMHKNEGS